MHKPDTPSPFWCCDILFGHSWLSANKPLNDVQNLKAPQLKPGPGRFFLGEIPKIVILGLDLVLTYTIFLGRNGELQ